MGGGVLEKQLQSDPSHCLQVCSSIPPGVLEKDAQLSAVDCFVVNILT
jgi:hypothetical protein